MPKLAKSLVASIVFGCLATIALQRYGFAVAHSLPLIATSVAVAPGIVVAFFGPWSGETVPALLASTINAAYYFGWWHLIRRMKKKGSI